MKKTLLLLLVSFQCFAQEIVFRGPHLTAGHEYNVQDRNPNANSETGLIYKNGTTYLFSSQVWNGYWKSMGTLLKYNDSTGLYPAAILTTEVQGEINRHLTTVGFVNTNKIYHLQEDRHSQMIEVWETDLNGYGSKKLYQTAVGTHFARALTYEYGDYFVNVCQQDAINMVSMVFNGTSYDAYKIIVKPAQALKRVYAQMPIGKPKDPDGWTHIIAMSSTSESHEEFFHIKTKDFINWKNHDETLSWTAATAPTINTLRSNNAKMFGEVNAPNGNLGDFISCVDDSGNVYAVAYRNYDNKLFFIDKYAGSYRQREFHVADSVSGYAHSDSIGVSERAAQWLAKRDGKFFLLMSVVDSVNLRKFHLFTSTDGIDWTDTGDIFPNVNEHMSRAKGPENFNDIPVGKKFAFAGCDDQFTDNVGVQGQVFFRETTYTDSIGPVSSQSAITGIDSLQQIPGARHIYVGSTVDKSGNGRNLIGTAVSSGGKVTSSTGLKIPNQAPYLADDQFTFVWKGKRLGNEYLLTFSDEATVTKYFAIKFPATESGGVMWQYVPANGSGNEGRVASVNDIVVGQTVTIIVTGNKYHVEFWINGVQSNIELFGSTSTPTFMGRWLLNLATTIDNGYIGALRRTTLAATATEFQVNAYWPRVVSYDELRKIFKLLE